MTSDEQTPRTIELKLLDLNELPTPADGPCLMKRRRANGPEFPWNPAWGFTEDPDLDSHQRSYALFERRADFDLRWHRDRFHDFHWTEPIVLPEDRPESFNPIDPEDDGFYAVKRFGQQFLAFLRKPILYVVIVRGATVKCDPRSLEKYDFLVRYEPGWYSDCQESETNRRSGR